MAELRGFVDVETGALERVGVPVEALQTLVAWANGAHICTRCHGTGDLADDPDDFLECAECEGSGEWVCR